MKKTILGLTLIIAIVAIYSKNENSLVTNHKSPENFKQTKKIDSTRKGINTEVPLETTKIDPREKTADKTHKPDEHHDHDKCIAENLGEAPLDEESQLSMDMERVELYPSNTEDRFRDAKAVYEDNGLELIEYNSDSR